MLFASLLLHLPFNSVGRCQFQDISSAVHMHVFAIMAAKEGKSRKTARPEKLDYGISAMQTADAVQEAQRTAQVRMLMPGTADQLIDQMMQGELPRGWTSITDPSTGAVAYWNKFTNRTVWTRPTD